MPISPEQSRAARGLLDWNQAQLAKASGLSLRSVHSFEDAESVSAATLDAIERALEAAGVEFLAEDTRGGPGVRLVKTKPRRKR